MPFPLTVYKASAGSGKTFTLATEFIKLLVLNPQNYKQILAVTFTNKATEEMKTRILSQLYGIWQGLEDSRSYARKVSEALKGQLSDEQIAERAGQALHLLLHNYSYFRVETIDSFFQSIMRNLARELNLAANLRVGLNDAQVEEMAVDQLIDSLTASDRVLQWLMKYIMEAPCGYWRTLAGNYPSAMRHWGLLFLVFFVSLLLVFLVGLVVMLPSHILSFANQQAYQGVLIGDPLGMPSYMTALTFVTVTFCSFIQFYVSQVTMVHNYYVYGSIETREQKRKDNAL